MAATVHIYLIRSSTNTSSSGVHSVNLNYLVTVTTTGTTSSANASMTISYGGPQAGYKSAYPSNMSGLSISENSCTALALSYHMNLATSGTATITVTLNMGSAGTYTAKKSVNLANVVWDSTTTMSVPSNITLGTIFTVSVGNSSSMTYDLRCYTAGGLNGVGDPNSAYFTVASGLTAGSHNLDISPSQMSSLMANATLLRTRMAVVAYSGSEIVGFNDGFSGTTLNMPASALPTISSPTVVDINGCYEKYGVYVQSKSDIQVVVDANGIYGSSVTKIAYSFDTLSITGTSETWHIGAPQNSGTYALKATVTDSRQRQATTSKDLVVAAYNNPTLTLKAMRWNTETSQESDASTTVRLVCSGTIPSINDYLISGTLTVQGRQKGVDVWTTIGTVSVSGTFEEIFTKTDQSIDYLYEYQVTLIDEFNTTVSQLSEIGTAKPVLEFHASGKGIGVGTVAPNEGFNVGYDLNLIGETGSQSITLAKFDESRLKLLEQIAGVDRAFIGSHLFMSNNMAIGGLTTSGEQIPMLRVNTSNQVELNWTSGGLTGHVRKLLWSGELSPGGTLTIPELPYYNILLVQANSFITPLFRSDYDDPQPSNPWFSGIGGYADGRDGWSNLWAVRLYVSGTSLVFNGTWTITFAQAQGYDSSVSRGINKIFGVI